MVDFAVVPERTALINVDMQNCFVQGYPSSAPDGLAVLDRINRLAAACRDAGILVIHTSQVLRPDGSNVGVLEEINPMVKGIITKGSESAALHEKLVVDARDILLDKPRHGAFQSTDLELILRSRRIDTVIISGIATSVCCETTAREAVARDFHVFFLSDGTATADMPGASAAELQKATLATRLFVRPGAYGGRDDAENPALTLSASPVRLAAGASHAARRPGSGRTHRRQNGYRGMSGDQKAKS